MFLCRYTQDHLSLGQIGNRFGGRDHTTVLYAYKRVQSKGIYFNTIRCDLIEILKSVDELAAARLKTELENNIRHRPRAFEKHGAQPR